jgi:hypothetical protein
MTQHKIFELAENYIAAYRTNEDAKRDKLPMVERNRVATKVGRHGKAFARAMRVYHLPVTTASIIDEVGKLHEKDIKALEDEIRALRSTVDDLRKAGRSASNCCFNLSQQAGRVLDESAAKSMKLACEEWDAASVAARSVLPPG